MQDESMNPNHSPYLEQSTTPPPAGPTTLDPLVLQSYLRRLEAEVTRLSLDAAAATQQNAGLSRDIEALRTLQGTNTGKNEVKLPLPSKFSGSRKDCRGFLNQLELVFAANPTRYSSGQVKINTVGALLDGKPLNWLNPYLEKRSEYPEMFSDYTIFKTFFLQVWGEQERALVSEHKIRKLNQGKSSTAVYASDFKNLAADLEWNDAALISQFRAGLSNAVKNLMLSHDVPKSLDATILLAIKLDNRIFEQSLDSHPRPFLPTARYSNSPVHQPTPISGPIPMDLSTATLHSHKRGPLTTEEKEKRRKEGLCLYCGGNNHVVNQCSLRPSPKSSKPTKQVTYGAVTTSYLGPIDDTEALGKEQRQ